MVDKAGVKIRQLQIFREVLRAGSERLAAKILGISQPAVSQHIKQLEAEIGFALFSRESNRLVPSDRAWEVLRSVDGALQGVDRIEKSLASWRSDDMRTIGLAAPGVFSLGVIPRAIKAIRQRSNRFSFQVKSGSYEQIAEHILSGRADLGISRLPLDARAFDWTPVRTARNVCLFPAGHRLASKDLITPQDIMGEALIDIEPRFSSHQMNINALRYVGVDPDIAVEYDANGHDAGFVAAGIGISVTNSVIAREYEGFGLTFRPFEPGAIYHYVVFWQKGRQLGNAMRLTLDELVASFGRRRD
jgi:DNA-binding transcriptional LysR family regulator